MVSLVEEVVNPAAKYPMANDINSSTSGMATNNAVINKKKKKKKRAPKATQSVPTSEQQQQEQVVVANTSSKEKKKRRQKKGKPTQHTYDENIEQLTPYQGDNKTCGMFYCEECEKQWFSPHSWANSYQKCKECFNHVYPYIQFPHEKNKQGPKNMLPHPAELCQKCMKLGHSCIKLYFGEQGTNRKERHQTNEQGTNRKERFRREE